MTPGAPSRPQVVRAFLALWKAVREWSGDAAYETYLSRADALPGPRLDRQAFYLDALRRRYRGPSRCC